MRGRDKIDDGVRWSSPVALAKRAYFVTLTKPAHLSVEVYGKDAGIYRCRVDFNNSPTINQKMNLTVIGEYDD